MRRRPDPHGLLACPVCRASLSWHERGADCDGGSHRYELIDGIPLLLPVDSDEHKARQADFFDSEDAEFEGWRPHGQVAMYGWLLTEKFRRATAGIEHAIPGATAVASCGGSGMDAEFLARAGAGSVISVDVSLGAARRARARAERFGLPIVSIVGDAERLPFRDASVDIAYVHDGLHHLADPYAGLVELARVARRAVSITEPSQALLTKVAVRAGIAFEEEDAGNRVGRMEIDRIRDLLMASGFATLHAERYGMFYRQQPGRPMRLISRRRLFPLAVKGVRIANRFGGPLGNKLTVQAVRDASRGPA